MGEAFSNIDTRVIRPAASDAQVQAWYAVQTGYRFEQKVATGLTLKGFEVYLPLLREVHQWKDRKKQMEVPAFGGYLFVRHDCTLPQRVKVLETTGVLRMLGGNHTPVAVDNTEIEALQRTLRSGVACGRCEFPAVGTQVRVTRGPLSGVEGRLLRIKNDFRLVISISTVSQAISAEIDLQDIEQIDLDSLQSQRCA